MAGVVGAALKNKKSSGRKVDQTFRTPARTGWGQVASQLYPDIARVFFFVELYWISPIVTFQILVGPLGGRITEKSDLSRNVIVERSIFYDYSFFYNFKG